MIELRPHQAVEFDRLLEQRHIDVAWDRRAGATYLGLYALAAHAVWEPGHYAWCGATGVECREAFRLLRHMLPEAGAVVAGRQLRLESATIRLENASEVWVFRVHDPAGYDALRGRRWSGVVSDRAFVRPHDLAHDWSMRIL